ncbi:stage II sporulation protein D [Thermosulfidibacter takaii ABI70S6]|uniref:Stage II sporulation protein D n=1 Tax=Thermosulfidibacter takaii (strain DSM 17441 / JCM 13301 / NBRC 103674 / ABI70S6) TaxID=1298851 RepID=A0A0S3QSP0_THET7|nr:SpoIID/LytB domain-containing protein [Thermosulfidibacter takaii]BAT71360.1 stage II sporulation protein D [Thermosulfidibacter takaii ABI70S6]
MIERSIKLWFFYGVAFLAFIYVWSSPSYALDIQNESLARWYINYASYLIDVGRYMEALESYETAYEMSAYSKTKAEALLAKAMLLATFLDAPLEAVKTYQQVEKEFPDKAEIAVYREALLFYQIGKYKEAKKALQRYKERFPQGRFQYQVEVLNREVSKALPPKPPKPPVQKFKEVPIVRVRIGRPTAKVDVYGDKSQVCIESTDSCSNSFVVKAADSEIKVDGLGYFSREVCFTSIRPMRVKSTVKKLLRGKVCVRPYKGRVLVINRVDIESYLLSVVPSESIASWPIETLKAQAVASRTYAYYQMLHRKDRLYDLVDNEGDQAYRGVTREHPRSTKAVKGTIGQVLVYDNRPILAMFSANSGGYTADPKAVFDLRKPYLVAKPDPESLKGQMAKWRRKYKVSEIENRLRRIGISVTGLVNIEPYKVGPSGRVVKVKIIDSKGVKVLRTRTTLRRALKLPDILVKIYKRGDEFVFEGRGFGHGVGYSQWGSAFMGKKMSYRDILKFYYPNAYLVKLW